MQLRNWKLSIRKLSRYIMLNGSISKTALWPWSCQNEPTSRLPYSVMTNASLRNTHFPLLALLDCVSLAAVVGLVSVVLRPSSSVVLVVPKTRFPGSRQANLCQIVWFILTISPNYSFLCVCLFLDVDSAHSS